MPELFDKPQSSLVLADAELAAIKQRLPKWAYSGRSDATIVDAEYLRRGWHKLIGGCTVLNGDRYLAAIKRLDEKIRVHDLAWAIQALANELKTDWRQSRPLARKPFEKFFAAPELDLYVEEGKKLSRKAASRQAFNQRQAATRQAADLERAEIDRQREERAALYRQYQALPAAERAEIHEQALAALGGAARAFGRRDESNPVIRNMLCKLIQRREQNDRLDVKPIGSVLEGN